MTMEMKNICVNVWTFQQVNKNFKYINTNTYALLLPVDWWYQILEYLYMHSEWEILSQWIPSLGFKICEEF